MKKGNVIKLKNNVIYQPTEKELQEWGKPIIDSLMGFTKDDLEPLFEKYILPIYKVCARRPDQESEWKIVNRKTGEEYSYETATEEFKKLISS